MVANHSGSKNPAQSVKVVIMIDDATAGSIPTLFKTNGMVAPVNPAIIKFPVMAKNKTKPSITFASYRQAIKKTIKPFAAPLSIPTKNSFNTVP